MRFEDAIQQKQFRSQTQKSWLNIVYTGNLLNHRTEKVLRQHGVSLSQYNILRILRGAKGQPMSLQDIKQRMLDHNPDVSRMIDRMVASGWVTRCEDPENRRKVQVGIDETGLRLLTQIDDDNNFMALHQPQNQLTESELIQLNTLLDRFREGFEA